MARLRLLTGLALAATVAVSAGTSTAALAETRSSAPVDDSGSPGQVYKLAYSSTLYADVDGQAHALTYDEWQNTYAFATPVLADTNYVKYPWSPTVYAVTFWGSSPSSWQWDQLSYTQYRSAGSPGVRNAGYVAGSYFYKWATSAQLLVVAPDGSHHALSYAEWQASGFQGPVDRSNEGFYRLSWSKDIARMTDIAGGRGYRIGYGEWAAEGFPNPQVVARIPGDTFYRYAGQNTVWYAGPTMNRPVTYSEWSAAGKPAPQLRPNTIPGDAGLLRVGVDVAPGTYQSTGNQSCYWARLSSLSEGDIIDNFFGNGNAYVTIAPTDTAFETERCGDWHLIG